MTLTTILAGPRELLEENKKCICLTFFTICYAGYLALGGGLFLLIEGPQEDIELEKTMKLKDTVMAKYPQVPGEAIDGLFKELSSNGVKGIVVDNSTQKWTFGNALLFSATLLTTIGYGHLSPMSPLGKIVCMFYTGMGIPLTLILLANYVEKLMMLSEYFKSNLFHKLGPYMKPIRVRVIHFCTVMTFIGVGCFLLPAWVFCWLEMKWSYLDAIYFCFISLTTVGLGDFVPGLIANHPYTDLYRFGAAVYIIVGVTVMMFMMAVTADFVNNYNKGYHILPVVITPEKYPIKTDTPSYGSVKITKQNSTDHNKNKILQKP